MRVTYACHDAGTLTARSGMLPLHYYVDSSLVEYEDSCARWKNRSWTLGHAISVLSRKYYGSAWNMLVPVRDELSLFRHMLSEQDVLHFLWGEFATPSMSSLFRRKARKIVGTFHCSQRRQWRVTRKPRRYLGYDHIVLMSNSQRDYFIDNDYPETQLSTIYHGVDVDYFTPGLHANLNDGALNLLLVGSTERDHHFAAEVLRSTTHVKCRVATAPCYHHFYDGISCVELLPRLSDGELVCCYQQADLLLMPMLDCTANNAILESMACGTPVMVNCIGGIPEYVDATCNLVMFEKKVDEWVDVLGTLVKDRDRLGAMRPQARAWAEHFDWRVIARKYVSLYERVLAS